MSEPIQDYVLTAKEIYGSEPVAPKGWEFTGRIIRCGSSPLATVLTQNGNAAETQAMERESILAELRRVEPAPALDFSDGGKHLRTRDGREVRIFATDAPLSQPVVGVIKFDDDDWGTASWNANGCFYPGGYESTNDLVPAAEPAKPTPKRYTFEETGEVRRVSQGDFFVCGDDAQCWMHDSDSTSKYPILRRVSAEVQG